MNVDGKENTNYTVFMDGVDVKIKDSFVKLPTNHISQAYGQDTESLRNDSNIIFEDSSDLPFGWSRFKERRQNSNSYDRCILTSCGTRIDRQKKLNDFISLKSLDLNIKFSGSDQVCCDKPEPAGSSKRKLVQSDISSFVTTGEDTGSDGKRRKTNVVGSLTRSLNTQQEKEKHSSPDTSNESSIDNQDKAEGDQEANEAPEVVGEAVEYNPATDNADLEDPAEKETDLPKGWRRRLVTKDFTKKTVVVIETPDGKRFENQKQLNSYIARNKLNVKVSIEAPLEEIESLEQSESEASEKVPDKKVSNDQEKKEKKKGKKERTADTDGSLTNKEVDQDSYEESLSKDEAGYITEIEKLMKSNSLPLTPSPPTRGDGNCWFRAVAEQVEYHEIQNKARNYRSLRLEVSGDCSRQ